MATFKRAAKPFVHIRLQFNPFLGMEVGMGVGGTIVVIGLIMLVLMFLSPVISNNEVQISHFQ